MNEIDLLGKLAGMPGFKMYRDQNFGLVVESDGVTYNQIPGYSMVETIFEAYLWISSHQKARDLVKNAKVSIE